MGVILDSSVLISGERRKESVREILKRVRAAHGEVDCALSVVTIVELTHGIYRAKSDADRERRRAFSEELRRDIVVHPVTVIVNQRTGAVCLMVCSGQSSVRFQKVDVESLTSTPKLPVP